MIVLNYFGYSNIRIHDADMLPGIGMNISVKLYNDKFWYPPSSNYRKFFNFPIKTPSEIFFIILIKMNPRC